MYELTPQRFPSSHAGHRRESQDVQMLPALAAGTILLILAFTMFALLWRLVTAFSVQPDRQIATFSSMAAAPQALAPTRGGRLNGSGSASSASSILKNSAALESAHGSAFSGR